MSLTGCFYAEMAFTECLKIIEELKFEYEKENLILLEKFEDAINKVKLKIDTCKSGWY